MTKTDNQEQVLYSLDYHYDVNDKRVGRTDASGEWTYYLRNATGMDIGVFSLTTKDFEWYVFGGGQRLATLFPQDKVQPTWLASTVTSASYSSTGDPFDATLKDHCFNCTYDSVHFFIYDHLGNTRLVYAPYNSGTEYVVQSALDYYPYGKPLRQWHIGLKERYQLTGNERDTESGLDYFNARFYDSDVGRFGAVDVARKKYPSLSTYNYCGLNPILLTDPDGREIIITHYNNQTRSSTVVRYDADGTLYDFYTGEVYDGDNSYALMVAHALDNLRSLSELSEHVVLNLVFAKQFQTITNRDMAGPGWPTSYTRARGDEPKSSFIQFAPKNDRDFFWRIGSGDWSNEEILANELKHAYNRLNGLTKKGFTPNGVLWEEVDSVDFQNIVRDAQEKSPRLRQNANKSIAEYLTLPVFEYDYYQR